VENLQTRAANTANRRDRLPEGKRGAADAPRQTLRGPRL